jgi:YVTN family beta-propeller protein
LPDIADFTDTRAALLVTTGTYTDPNLGQLRSPIRDSTELAAVLADPRIGEFTVSTVLDGTDSDIRRAVVRFLSAREPVDVVLLYLSCHGLTDPRGRLYFAATNTTRDELRATAVDSTWLLEELEECRARRQVLILDCCFSGAFARGAKADGDGLDLQRRFTTTGRGRIVLTASGAAEYSYEGTLLTDGTPTASVFTAGLVEGLRTGAADRDRDGWISVEDAYQYAAGHVASHGTAQSPRRWVYGGEGSVILARNPHGPSITAGTALDEGLADGVEGGRPRADVPPAPIKTRSSIKVVIVSLALVLIGGVVSYLSSHLGIHNHGSTSSADIRAIVATIPVGKGPSDIAIDPGTHMAYVTDYDDRFVSVFDTNTNQIAAIIRVGGSPTGVAVDPTAHTAYVTNSADDTVSVIDTTTNTVTGTLRVGKHPWGVAIDSGARTAYVVNSGDDTLAVINTTTEKVTTHEPPLDFKNPIYAVAVDPTSHNIYLGSNNGSIPVVNVTINTLVDVIQGIAGGGFSPDAVVIDPTTHTLYATNTSANTVAVIDTITNTVTGTIGVARGDNPWGTAIDSGKHTAYITDTGGGSISVVDTTDNDVMGQIHVGRSPQAAVTDPISHRTYVVNHDDATVSVIAP